MITDPNFAAVHTADQQRALEGMSFPADPRAAPRGSGGGTRRAQLTDPDGDP